MYPQRTRARARSRRRRRRWPLFLLVFAIALCALGASQLGFGQMHRLKTADLPDWVDQQIIPVNGAARRGGRPCGGSPTLPSTTWATLAPLPRPTGTTSPSRTPR